MACRDRVSAAVVLEALTPELPKRFQQLIPPLVVVDPLHHRLVDQGDKYVKDARVVRIGLIEMDWPAHRLDRP